MKETIINSESHISRPAATIGTGTARTVIPRTQEAGTIAMSAFSGPDTSTIDREKTVSRMDPAIAALTVVMREMNTTVVGTGQMIGGSGRAAGRTASNRASFTVDDRRRLKTRNRTGEGSQKLILTRSLRTSPIKF